MANSKQAIKRAKQNAETYKLRHAQRSMVRTAVKAVRASIEANDVVKAKELLTNAEKVLDSSASKKSNTQKCSCKNQKQTFKSCKSSRLNLTYFLISLLQEHLRVLGCPLR
jgi:small subunit ribosomal protein S20